MGSSGVNDYLREHELGSLTNMCRVEYRDVQIAFSYEGPGEIIAATIKFVLKELRKYFLMSHRCTMDYCKNVPCTLRKIFRAACVKGKVNSNINLAPFISSLENDYKGACSYDSLFECFLIYMHSFDRSQCTQFRYKESPFFCDVTQEFECKCRSRFSKSLDMSSYLTVNIKDFQEFSRNQLCFVLRSQLNAREFNLCNNPVCIVRKCQRNLDLKKEPLYIMIKLNWMIEIQCEIIHRSLQQNIKPSDIFKTDFQSDYRLCIIATDDMVFHLDLGNWMHDIRNVGSFNELLAYLSSIGKKISFIVYQKSDEVLVNRSDSQLRNNKSPSGLTKYTVAFKPQSNKCEKCGKFTDSYLSKCVCKENGKPIISKCYKCNENFTEEKLYKHSCQPMKDVYIDPRTTNSFSQQKCMNCRGPSTNSSLCTNCSLGSQLSVSLNSKTAAKAPPKQLNCKLCRSVTLPGMCMACFNETSTEICKNCRKTTVIYCKKCFNASRTPKRAASSIRRKVCEICKSAVNSLEEKNCFTCYKRFEGAYCLKCKIRSASKYLCDTCMKRSRR